MSTLRSILIIYVLASMQFRSPACFTLRHFLHYFNFLQCVLQQTPYCVRSAWRLDLAYMESAAAWAGPYELQLAMNGTTEEASPANDAQHKCGLLLLPSATLCSTRPSPTYLVRPGACNHMSSLLAAALAVGSSSINCLGQLLCCGRTASGSVVV